MGFAQSSMHRSMVFGNPTRLILTGGQEFDYDQAFNLLESLKADFVLEDKGYDADDMIEAILEKGEDAMIPPKIKPNPLT